MKPSVYQAQVRELASAAGKLPDSLVATCNVLEALGSLAMAVRRNLTTSIPPAIVGLLHAVALQQRDDLPNSGLEDEVRLRTSEEALGVLARGVGAMCEGVSRRQFVQWADRWLFVTELDRLATLHGTSLAVLAADHAQRLRGVA